MLVVNPLRVYCAAYGLKRDEVRLKSMVDSGMPENILRKFEPNGRMFYRLGKPFDMAQLSYPARRLHVL